MATRIPCRRGENGTLVADKQEFRSEGRNEKEGAKVKAFYESFKGSLFRFSKEARFPYRGLPLDSRERESLWGPEILTTNKLNQRLVCGNGVGREIVGNSFELYFLEVCFLCKFFWGGDKYRERSLGVRSFGCLLQKKVPHTL